MWGARLPAMSTAKSLKRPLVLKFGGAVLGGEGGVERAAAFVARERAARPEAGVVVVEIGRAHV